MNKTEVIYLHEGGKVFGYEKAKPNINDFKSIPFCESGDCKAYQDELRAHEQSGIELKFYPGEEDKIIKIYSDKYRIIEFPIDITSFCEVRLFCCSAGYEYELCDRQCLSDGINWVFFKDPKEPEETQENQTTLASEIISIVKNHTGSGGPLISLITKFEFKRRNNGKQQ